MHLELDRKPSLILLAEMQSDLAQLLPVESLVALDILLAAAKIGLASENVTVKTFFRQLPHSEMGIRYQFNKLVKDGWIELDRFGPDARTKYVRPSSRLLEKIHEFEEIANPKIIQFMEHVEQ